MKDERYLTGSEFRKFAHISTRVLKYVMDQNLIDHVDTGQPTHRYLILMEDAEQFAIEYQNKNSALRKSLRNKFARSAQKPGMVEVPLLITDENKYSFKVWLRKRWDKLPEHLEAATIFKLTGIRPQYFQRVASKSMIHKEIWMGYAIYSKTEIINHITDPENVRKFIAQKFQDLISEFLETMPGTKMSEKK